MLAACVEPVPVQPGDPPPGRSGQGVVEWNRGGVFSGSEGGRLYADDSLVTLTRPPFGDIQENRRQLTPGSYERAVAYLRANPIPARDLGTGQACPDYGTDQVSWQGPAANGSPISYSVSCPNDAVRALRSGLLRVIGLG